MEEYFTSFRKNGFLSVSHLSFARSTTEFIFILIFVFFIQIKIIIWLSFHSSSLLKCYNSDVSRVVWLCRVCASASLLESVKISINSSGDFFVLLTFSSTQHPATQKFSSLIYPMYVWMIFACKNYIRKLTTYHSLDTYECSRITKWTAYSLLTH